MCTFCRCSNDIVIDRTSWSAILQIIAILAILLNFLGIGALAGVALLVIVSPVQGKLTRILSEKRKVRNAACILSSFRNA